MFDKLELTTQLVAQLPEDQRLTVNSALQQWWFNFRNAGGLRLTEEGMYVFRLLNITHYKFGLSEYAVLSGSLLLTLDKKLTCPYFLNQGKEKYLLLYGGKEATMLAMYGDIKKFVNSLSAH
jgi:hypothetical protein